MSNTTLCHIIKVKKKTNKRKSRAQYARQHNLWTMGGGEVQGDIY